MHRFLLLTTLAVSTMSIGQNQVFNGEFEDPTAFNLQTTSNASSNFIEGWKSSGNGNPDYFYDTEKVVIKPEKGLGVLGFTTHWSDSSENELQVIRGRLIEPLIANKIYRVNVDIALHRTCQIASSGLAVIFSENLLPNAQLVSSNYIPVDVGEPLTNMTWKTIEIHFIAKGGERYISFGNFGKQEPVLLADVGIESHKTSDGKEASAYYYVDNFWVQEENGSKREELQTSFYGEQAYSFVFDLNESMKSTGAMEEFSRVFKEVTANLNRNSLISIQGMSEFSQIFYRGTLKDFPLEEIDVLFQRAIYTNLNTSGQSIKEGIYAISGGEVKKNVLLFTNNPIKLDPDEFRYFEQELKTGTSISIFQFNTEVLENESLIASGFDYRSVEIDEVTANLESLFHKNYYCEGRKLSTGNPSIEYRDMQYSFVIATHKPNSVAVKHLRGRFAQTMGELPDSTRMSVSSFYYADLHHGINNLGRFFYSDTINNEFLNGNEVDLGLVRIVRELDEHSSYDNPKFELLESHDQHIVLFSDSLLALTDDYYGSTQREIKRELESHPGVSLKSIVFDEELNSLRYYELDRGSYSWKECGELGFFPIRRFINHDSYEYQQYMNSEFQNI
ncbi:MAG: hypothetical protein ACI837_000261 [Crocinitomicaceae bacterium]|jgi:hypothetical protein